VRGKRDGAANHLTQSKHHSAPTPRPVSEKTIEIQTPINTYQTSFITKGTSSHLSQAHKHFLKIRLTRANTQLRIPLNQVSNNAAACSITSNKIKKHCEQAEQPPALFAQSIFFFFTNVNN